MRTLLDLSRFLIPWIAIVALSAQGDGDWFRQDFEGSQVGAEFDPLENLILEGTFVISEEKAGKVLAVSQGSTGEFGFMFGPALTSGSLQVDYFAESGSRRLQPRFGIRACGMRGPALFYDANTEELTLECDGQVTTRSLSIEWRRNWLRFKLELGPGAIQGKVWPRDKEEPKAWSIRRNISPSESIFRGRSAVYGLLLGDAKIWIDNLRLDASTSVSPIKAKPTLEASR